MGLNFTDFVTKDFVYKQNPDHSYSLDNGKLQLVDRNAIVDAILEMLKNIYTGIVQNNNINPGEIMCNDYVLDQVLIRYSRDIFGEMRLHSKVEYLANIGRITPDQKTNLEEYSDYGFKTNSREPYLHRRVANLFYWLSVLKPFSIYPKDIASVMKTLGVAFTFHNEYISYLLILSVLKAFDVTLNIHKNKVYFSDFLYDLHFRNLSRSALEFFLHSNIKSIHPH
jgi:hypothetical protein